MNRQPVTKEAAKTDAISLGTLHFKEANQKVRTRLKSQDCVRIEDVYAQRYLGCAMPCDKRLEIFGTPGNDLGCYMDGGEIEVYGNAQDQIGNTMNAGRIVVHGRCGDAAGYGMRGGEIYIRDDCGWRVGINMKQYEDRIPKIVIGGNSGSFLGEYMAGGIIVLMGSFGEYIASGMHGGVIYLRDVPDGRFMSFIPGGLSVEKVEEHDLEVLEPLLERYRQYFGNEGHAQAGDYGARAGKAGDYYKICPVSSRPYASMYA